MKVGYYLANIKTNDGGIYQYSIYILKMLLKCDQIEQIVIFYSKGQETEFEHQFSNSKVYPVECKTSHVSKLLKRVSDFYLSRHYIKSNPGKILLKLYKLFNPDRRFLNKFNIDVLHIPRQHSPAYRLKFPVIISMHDVQHFHFPEFFTPVERIHKSISYYSSLSEADHVIVSYDHIKIDLIKYFRIDSKKISVCPVPIDEDWMSEVIATGNDELVSNYRLKDPMILTPAATWEHKNHLILLEAIAKLRNEGMKVYWVATGNKTPFFSKIEARIKELNLGDQVTFTGVVPDSDLKGLYNITRLVVIPTLYEAGSGPLVEAMRYKAPVICSNVTSLPDIIGNPDFIFDPLNIIQLATLIKKSISDNDFVQRNLLNSEHRIEKLINQNYADQFILAYNIPLKDRKLT
jgi:glycosyltransferase involved in cell wall biosynthesis